jgi:hypothetical protein
MKNPGLVIGVFLIVGLMAVPAALAQVSIGGDQGLYEVRCNVDGAAVYFDTTFVGYTSQGILEVPVFISGTPYKTFTVSKPGYETYKAPILQIPGPGETIVLRATLKANQIASTAMLNILSDPPGATVYVDGVNEGIVPPSGVMLVEDVVPGNHAVELRLAGFRTFTTDVYVNPNEVKLVRITLVPVTTGGLSVTSIPTGAEVYIDDLFKGPSPVTVSDLSPGSHTVLVRLPGYQDWSSQVQVNAGANTQVTAGLAPVATTPTTAPSPTKAGGFPVIVFSGLVITLILYPVIKKT